jgi:phosphoglycerate kinase
MRVIIMSHLGRPTLKREEDLSLRLITTILSEMLNNQKVYFFPEINEVFAKKTFDVIKPGEVCLLENLRFFQGEKKNDAQFAQLLSQFGDIYINDAFGVCHRKHASVSRIQNFFPTQKYKGFLLENELLQLKKMQKAPIEPYTIIVGGAKIGSKIHILQAFLNVADYILIGGGMAFPFVKYLGGEIGASLCRNEELDVVEKFLLDAKKSTTKIILPVDCCVTNSIEKREDIKILNINKIPENYMGVDIGPKTIKLFSDFIQISRSIMWNGPMGVSEIDEFSNGTKQLANIIIKTTSGGCFSLIGGGDTISDVSRFGMKSKFSYVSTGGGAMLEFFKNNNLPGALNLSSINT